MPLPYSESVEGRKEEKEGRKERRRRRKGENMRKYYQVFNIGGVYMGVHINPPLYFLFL